MGSFMHRTMMYLGLVDEEEDYDNYEKEGSTPRNRDEPNILDQKKNNNDNSNWNKTTQSPAIRSLHKEENSAVISTTSTRQPVVRPLNTPTPKVHVVSPTQFGDAQEIGDRLKEGEPVIVNLQVVPKDLARRMIDFCSGCTYVLGGTMEKVADQVFLLSPQNVEVPVDEKKKLQERLGRRTKS